MPDHNQYQPGIAVESFRRQFTEEKADRMFSFPVSDVAPQNKNMMIDPGEKRGRGE